MDDAIRQVEEALLRLGTGPSSVSTDGVTVNQPSIQNVMTLMRFLAAKEAVKQPHLGIVFRKLVPPGTV